MKHLILFSILTSAFAANAKPVIDFSEDRHWQFNDSLYAFQEDQILKQLFPKYAKDVNQCADGAELIDNGLKVVRGSFTTKGADELVVVFMSSACPGSHAGQHGNVALVRDLKVIDARNDLATESLEQLVDVDGDGASELITSAFGGNQGYFQTVAATLSFRGGRIKSLDYVSGVTHTEDCGAKDDNTGHVIDAVFFPIPSNPYKTLQKNYIRKCSQGKEGYRFHSDGPLEGI